MNGVEIGLVKLTYSQLICNQRVLHAALCAGVMYMVYGSLEPILSLRLKDYSGLNDTTTGLVFGVEPLTYMLSTFMIPYIVPSWVEPRVSLITSSFLLVFATAIVGPFFES